MNAIWTRAQEAHDTGSDYVAVLKEMTLEKTDPEAKFLKDFCATALTGGRSNRVHLYALALADITEYLPVAAIAERAARWKWPDLRARHAGSSTRQTFKDWMTRQFRADYSDGRLIAAVSSLDDSRRLCRSCALRRGCRERLTDRTPLERHFIRGCPVVGGTDP